MDLNSLLESGTAIWTLIATSGTGIFISVLTFSKVLMSGKKFTKVSDFAVVADQSIKFAKSEIKDAKKEIVDETRKTIVEPLKEQVLALVSDNAQLASLTVSLLSYVPLPLEVKKDAVTMISKLSNVSSEAKRLLDSSIGYQEKQVALEQSQTSKLNSDIDKI